VSTRVSLSPNHQITKSPNQRNHQIVTCIRGPCIPGPWMSSECYPKSKLDASFDPQNPTPTCVECGPLCRNYPSPRTSKPLSDLDPDPNPNPNQIRKPNQICNPNRNPKPISSHLRTVGSRYLEVFCNECCFDLPGTSLY